MYAIMLAKIIKNRIKCKKLLLTSAAINLTGILVVIPQILLYMNVHMGYKEAQFFTVTLFYISPLCDSLLYYWMNPKVLEKLPDTVVGRAAAWVSEGVGLRTGPAHSNLRPRPPQGHRADIHPVTVLKRG